MHPVISTRRSPLLFIGRLVYDIISEFMVDVLHRLVLMTNVGAAVESNALLIKIRMTLIIMVTVWAIMESRQTSRHKYSSGALFTIAFASLLKMYQTDL